MCPVLYGLNITKYSRLKINLFSKESLNVKDCEVDSGYRAEGDSVPVGNLLACSALVCPHLSRVPPLCYPGGLHKMMLGAHLPPCWTYNHLSVTEILATGGYVGLFDRWDYSSIDNRVKLCADSAGASSS